MFSKYLVLPLTIATILFSNSAHSSVFRYFSSYEYQSSSDSHYLSFGVRAELNHLSFELSNGLKKANRDSEIAKDVSNGTLFALNVYPFQNKYAKNRIIISYTHLSDIFRGKPFNNDDEPYEEFFGAGYSMRTDKLETQILFGLESHEFDNGEIWTYSKRANAIKATIKYNF